MDKSEIELDIEKQRLEYVEQVINEEILNCIYKRKGITEAIINYRKEAVEEFKDDEDQIAEYFDHERYISEESFRIIDKKLKELTILKEVPYFAKIVINETGMDEQIYIGRFGLNRESDFEPIVVDWRAPVASLFYSGELGKVSYNAPKGTIFVDVLLKRQFLIKKGHLQGMFDSSTDIKDEILQMVLSSNSGEKLKDIIMTIQAEQDKLIRYDRNKTIVVNGVAGSGKTTVALHRVAYLLYNYRNILENKVLIIGPNNIFMDYISTVLPSLGEVGVRQTTFREFALELLEAEDIMPYKEFMESCITGKKEFTREYKYKESEEFLKSLKDLVVTLNKSYFKIQDVKFYDETIVSTTEIKKMFDEYFKDLPLFRRSNKIKRIIFSKIKDESYRKVNEVNRNHKKMLESLSEEHRVLEQNNIEFMRRIKIKEIIREAVSVKKMLKWLEAPEINDLYNEFNKYKMLTFQDLSPMLYLSSKLNGLRVKNEVKHIVIDEAQDYSYLQFEVLKEITGCKSFTIVGDTNQRIIPLEGESPMLSLHKIYDQCEIEYFNLNTSYRSTNQIMNYANKFLGDNHIIPLVREGAPVLEKDFKDINEMASDIIKKLKEFKDKGFESIAVICKGAEDTRKIGSIIKQTMHINIFDNEDSIYKGGEVIIPSYYAKGMEFDCVINVIISKEENNINENKLKYVMGTRALHEMCWYQLL
ncbi:MAG: HelD family protein [Solirubrobacterales bacterium]